MSRLTRRSFGVLLVAALLACTQNGQAAPAEPPAASKAGPVEQATPAAPGAGGLYREAAAQSAAPVGPEGTVPQASLAPLIERLKPAVVNISTTTAMKHPPIAGGPRGGQGGPGQKEMDEFFERFFGGRPAPEMPEEFRGSSLGSGFILNGEGFILTNNHVVKDATDILVRLSDGREFKAEVVGKDPPTDVALIRLTHPPKNLPTVVLGDSDALRQGDYVLALGSPFGLRDTATLGIVSAKNRGGVSPGGGTYDDFIQTDASINPGNSGGPLFNLRGEVVGINTAIVSPQIGQGIGFAVPITLAKNLLPQLREKGKVTRGFMGVSVQDLTPDLRQAFALAPEVKGALVQNVVPKGPAAKAGLEPGDVVTTVNGKEVDSSGALTRNVALVQPGQNVNVTVLRKGEKKQFTFKVAQRPDDEARVARGEFDEDGGGQGQASGEGDKAPKLGVNLAPIGAEEARELEVEPGSGALVREVVPGGPADRAGIRPGDVIVEVNRQPVKAPADIASRIGKMKDGEMALLRVRRAGTAVYIAVPVGGRQ
jgi:serine protease Do